MKICELHCELCNIPDCVLCISSQKHQFHDVTEIKNTLERKKNVLKLDLEELEKYIYPKYQEIVSSISEQKANLTENYQQLTTLLKKLLYNDIHHVNTYKSRNVDFKRLQPKLVVSIPKFSF